MERGDESSAMGRRRFLGLGTMGGVGLLASKAAGAQQVGPAATSSYARLNRTNTYVADNYFRSGRPWVDVRAYGAKGDGLADDTTAIQAALDSLPTAGGIVLVPQGLYKITAPIKIQHDYVTLRGIGRGSEIYAGSGWSGTALVISNGYKGVRIEDLWLDGQNGRAPLGIDMTPPSMEAHNWIRSNHIVGCLSGIRIGPGGFGCHVMHNTIGTNALVSGTTRGVDLQGPDNIVSFNRVTNFQEAGIYLAAGGQQIIGNHLFAYINLVTSAPYPTAIRVAAGGLDVIEGNYLDCVRQNAVVVIQPETSGKSINRILLKGNVVICSKTMRDGSDSADANYPVVKIDSAIGTVADVHIEGNLGVATVATPFSSILAQSSGVVGTALLANDFEECNTWWDVRPERYGSNTISQGGSYSRGLNEAAWGLVLKTKAGTLADGDFDQEPIDGTIAVDTKNSKLSVRIGGVWKTVALT